MVIIFPWAKAAYFDYRMNSIMKSWESGEKITPNVLKNDNNESNEEDSIVNADGVWDENLNPKVDENYIMQNIEGTITIDKINLKAPIVRLATKQNLDITICSLQYNPTMGAVGNYILAGHKSRIYGRHFNRLHELKVGDSLVLDNGSEKFNYFVSKVFIIKATDTSVLEQTDKEKIVTLITCDYSTNPIGRLALICKEVDDKKKFGKSRRNGLNASDISSR